MSTAKRIAISAAMILALLAPAAASQAASLLPGDLIKAPTIDTVYYFGQDGKRYVFPNSKTYFTWYSTFGTVKVIPLTDLQNIPLAGNVTYRPGVKMVKITTDPKVYAVSAHGTLRWVMSEQIANQLYGSNWNHMIDDVPDAFFVNYTVGTPISDATQYSPSGEMATAATISIDKNLATNAAPIVSLSSNLNSVPPNGTVQLTLNATFQGSGVLQSAVVRNNGITIQNCATLPCTFTSPALLSGTTNQFTAAVTDTNGQTGNSNPVTVTATTVAQNVAPVVTLTSNANAVAANATVQLTANATFTGGAFQSARIRQNGNVIGNCTALPCTITSPALPANSTQLFTADVTDTNGLNGTSPTATVTVNAQ